MSSGQPPAPPRPVEADAAEVSSLMHVPSEVRFSVVTLPSWRLGGLSSAGGQPSDRTC